MEELIAYLLGQGWVFRGEVYVRFSSPRLGWKPDGTMIVGYHEHPQKITTVEQMETFLRRIDAN